MCSACGIPTHVLELDEVAPSDEMSALSAGTPPPAKFAALRNKDCRPYLFGAALAMMADNIEHVITYWVLWQKFHSPALTGFEVISHWVPFLLFSVYFGSLADRYDCRRLIQGAQVLFMLVSAMWGVFFLTNSLTVWEACVLLVLHGCAGSMWAPGEQLMLHDFVGREELPSAVRLNSTFRSLGILFGPVVGSALLLGLGPTRGIFVNIAIYLPLTLFLFRTKFTGHTRDHGLPRTRVGLRDSVRVFRDIRSNRVIVSMIILGGLGSFFIGASLQTSMPIFAHDFGLGSAGTAYGVLLFASGLGGVIGGVLLEVTGRIKPTVTAAVVSTAIYGVTTLFFAFTGELRDSADHAVHQRGGQPGLDVDRADRGAAARPGPGPRPGGRPVRGVGQRAAGRQRVHRRPARRGDRDPLVARAELGRAVRGHGGGGLLRAAWAPQRPARRGTARPAVAE